MPRSLRHLLFSLVLGFHNAWEHDDADLHDLARRHRIAYSHPGMHPLDRPARSFFWAESSLAN
jgi:hypothetical protein